MALNVRINHKFDSYSAWMGSSLILGKGELAICEIPSTQTESGLTPPAIGIKVGDGSKTFAQLNWVQATAGDVYSWAKAAKKPEYTAEEISGLADFIGEEIQDTNTTYTFEFANDTLTVKHKEKVDAEYTVLAELPIDLSTKADKVANAVEGNLAALDASGNLVDSGAKIADYVTTAAADAKYETIANVAALSGTVSGINERLATAESEIDDLQGAIETLNGAGEGSVKATVDAAINEFATNVTDDNVVNSFKELVDWAAEHGGDAADMAAAIEDNAEAIATLEGKAHEHANKETLDGISADKVTAWDGAVSGLAQELLDRAAADETLQGNIEAEAKARGDEDTRLAGLIGENADAIAALEGKAHEHSNKEVLDDITADQVTAWDAAVQSISGVETTKTGTDVAVTGVSVDLLKNGDATLVLECGTATTVL